MSEMPIGALVLATAPTAEPVLLSDAVAHMRLDESPTDEDLVLEMVKAGKDMVEALTARRLITQTWKWYLDEFPSDSYLKLPLAPVASVTHIKYTDRNSVESTFAASNYIVDTKSEPARIVLKTGCVWPTPADSLKEANGVEIQFVVGYGASGASVPAALKIAVKVLAQHFYENRDLTTPLSLNEVPMSVQRIVKKYRLIERVL